MDNDIHYKEGKKKKKKSNKDNERKTKLGPTATWTDAYCAFQCRVSSILSINVRNKQPRTPL